MFKIIFFVIVYIFSASNAANLETVRDTDLLNLIKTEKYVVTLFTKNDCATCDNYENELIHLREDLVDLLSAWVVKVVNSQVLQAFSPNKEPVLLFFRRGIPLLYDDDMNDEKILTTFIESKEPAVKDLTDDTFEHLTQASTGATTGDWFIMFYSTDNADSLRLTATWETVAAKLRHRINVARVDKYTSGTSTSRRFKISKVPEFIFFRHGKMYRYHNSKYDINSLVSFAKGEYKDGEEVPVPQSQFDDITQIIANILRENPWITKIGSITIGVVIIVSITSKLKRMVETPQKKEK